MNDDQTYQIEQLKRQVEVLAAERDHARHSRERMMEIMMSVYGLISGPDVVLPDGRRMRFNNPHANETLHALSEAIRSIPDRIASEQKCNE